MRKLPTLLVILCLLLVAGGWWAVDRSGRLPDWYLEAVATERLEADLEAAARRAQQGLVGRFGRELIEEVTADDGTPDESFLERIQRRGKMVLEGLREGREVRLDAADLESLMLAMAYETPDGRQLLAATRAVHAEILGDQLELGAVVAPAELPEDRLSPTQRRLLDLLLALGGSDGAVYVALRAPPVVVEERLFLGPPVTLRAGELEVGPRLLAALGVEAPELDTGVPLDVGRMKVRQAKVDGDVLLLVVSPEI